MNTTKLEVNVNSEFLERATEIIRMHNMALDDAINLYLEGIVCREGIPFDYVNMHRPNVIDARGMDPVDVWKMLGVDITKNKED